MNVLVHMKKDILYLMILQEYYQNVIQIVKRVRKNIMNLVQIVIHVIMEVFIFKMEIVYQIVQLDII